VCIGGQPGFNNLPLEFSAAVCGNKSTMTRIPKLLPAAALALASLVQGAQAPGALPAPPNQDAKMQWFREAKFGLFIHWGLYCIPAGEWKGQPVKGIGEWIMNRAKIPVAEYEQLAKQFDPVKFNADQWVQMAQDAGMKYIVITSKHHDGFAMYHSQVSKYNVYDATPWHRDPMKELSAAAARHHIKFGFYYSQAQDWHEPNGAGNTWDFGPDDKKDYDQYLRGKAEPQVREILSGYGPICLVWFDTPRMMTDERANRFIDIVHELQPATLIDGRLGKTGDYRSMGDNKIPDEVVPGDWEVPATINHTWGYKKDDTDWKTPEDLTFKLVDIVSKGGNYLLNVGPTSEGVIPQACQDNLRAVGRWLKVNGEAIYGAKPTAFPEQLKQTDWRCTTKPGKIYLTMFKWPAGTFEVSGVKGTVRKAYLLAGKKSVKVKQDGDKVTLTGLPATGPTPIASVVVLEM
jgi:alpha-L-fucosidase